MKFTEFGFSANIIKALETLGFEDATEVQEKSIPLILERKNLVVRSQTGSGKTFAFGLPLLQNVEMNNIFPETLIICPTRELTLQVADELKKITGYMEGVKVVPVYGGSNISRQVLALKRKPQIIVGTPGRILDHIERKTLKLHYLKNVVLDEADEMLNMGFKEDIEKILKSTPETRRTLLFSATYPEKIKQLVNTFIPEHEKVEIGSENKSLKNIAQQYVLVNKKDKENALFEVLESIKEKHILIFCNTKAMTEKIANTLNTTGFEAASLHGDLKQSQRKLVTQDFKFKKFNILVASDVAARGLDISGIDYVINYDIPSNLEYFLHRMGRTARAGKNGNAITIITSKNQLKDLQAFEKETESSIKELKTSLSDFVEEPVKKKEGRSSRKPSQSKEKVFKERAPRERQERNFKEDKPREGKKDNFKQGGFKSKKEDFKSGSRNKRNDFKPRSLKKDKDQSRKFKNKSAKVEEDFIPNSTVFEKVKRKKELLSKTGESKGDKKGNFAKKSFKENSKRYSFNNDRRKSRTK